MRTPEHQQVKPAQFEEKLEEALYRQLGLSALPRLGPLKAPACARAETEAAYVALVVRRAGDPRAPARYARML